MRFTIDRDELTGTAGWVAGIIPGKTADATFAGMRLDAAAGLLTLSGSDYETTGRAAAAADVARDGSAVVPGRFFAEVVKSLPREPVTVELEDSMIVVTCSATQFTVPSLRPGTGPQLPGMSAVICTMPATDFAAAVASTAAALSTDAALPVLTGVRAEFGDGTLTMIGTDRYRMTVTVLPCTLEPGAVPEPVTVPGKVLAGFAKAAADARGKVTVGIAGEPGASLVGLSDGTRHLVTRSIPGDYPDWRTRFVQPPAFSITVPTGPAAEAVRRCAVAADDAGDAVRLAFSGSQVHVGLSRGDGASGTETVRGVTFDRAGEFVLWFRPQYLLDALTTAGSAMVRLGVQNASRAVLFTRAPAGSDPATATCTSGDEPFRCLLVPIPPNP
jgi:DNA polymerase-3 subunit beta